MERVGESGGERARMSEREWEQEGGRERKHVCVCARVLAAEMG